MNIEESKTIHKACKSRIMEYSKYITLNHS